jgi:hypothetical protein
MDGDIYEKKNIGTLETSNNKDQCTRTRQLSDRSKLLGVYSIITIAMCHHCMARLATCVLDTIILRGR